MNIIDDLKLQYRTGGIVIKLIFWNTALFLGAGYRNENITLGIRYNILHRDRDNIYAEAFMPFVRIYF